MVKFTYLGGRTVTCSWGHCPNTSQKNPTLRFIPFPTSQFEYSIRVARWAWLCGRENFTENDITNTSYICAEHFDSYENVEDLNPKKNQNLEPYPHPSVALIKAPNFFVKPKISVADFKCESCGKSFSHKYILIAHISEFHEKDHENSKDSNIKEENEKVIVEENSLDYQTWHRIPDDLHYEVKSKTANFNEKIFHNVQTLSKPKVAFAETTKKEKSLELSIHQQPQSLKNPRKNVKISFPTIANSILSKPADRLTPYTKFNYKDYTCHFCERSFFLENDLKYHIDKNHPTIAICEFCGKSFNGAQNLKMHISIIHEGNKPFKSESYNNCKKLSTKPTERDTHIKIVPPDIIKNKCIICGKSFSNFKDLNAHIDSHDRRKCQKCQIYFHSVADLKKHICNGDTKHTCKTCGKSFSGAAYMKKHIHLVHEGPDEGYKIAYYKDHRCDFCGKSFTGAQCLKKHIRTIHEGNKPFKSESCNSYQPAKSNQDFTNSEDDENISIKIEVEENSLVDRQSDIIIKTEDPLEIQPISMIENERLILKSEDSITANNNYDNFNSGDPLHVELPNNFETIYVKEEIDTGHEILKSETEMSSCDVLYQISQ